MGLCGVLWDWTIIWDYMGLGEKVQDRDFAAGVGERVGMWECAGVTPLRFGNPGVLSVLAVPGGAGCCLLMSDFPGIQPGGFGIVLQEQSHFPWHLILGLSFWGHWCCRGSTSAPRMGFLKINWDGWMNESLEPGGRGDSGKAAGSKGCSSVGYFNLITSLSLN